MLLCDSQDFFWLSSHLNSPPGIRENPVLMSPTPSSPSTCLCLQWSLISCFKPTDIVSPYSLTPPRCQLITLRSACSPTAGLGLFSSNTQVLLSRWRLKLWPQSELQALLRHPSLFVSVKSWSQVLSPRPLFRLLIYMTSRTLVCLFTVWYVK